MGFFDQFRKTKVKDIFPEKDLPVIIMLLSPKLVMGPSFVSRRDMNEFLEFVKNPNMSLDKEKIGKLKHLTELIEKEEPSPMYEDAIRRMDEYLEKA